ncbi:hypothetical protein A3Q56_08487 [Intoshia linei]|uniref:(+)RNA virus helicase C-terminal domain-containing protein n=1 Tax=Intoshia linei TaxID=1819745 RepID=A0A177AP42_9BILA|nr:hypothetical protein A3Q56_08487 [Intoshia linei]
MYFDEALMSHPGALLLCAFVCGATDLYFVGDFMQIPFVSRLPDFYLRYTSLPNLVKLTSGLSLSC